MVAARSVKPEILDELLPTDPRAVGSRSDLRRINRWMMQGAIMTKLMRGFGDDAPGTILELGSGDGTFMLAVAQRLAPLWRGVTVRLLDRQGLVTDKTRQAFAALGWKAVPIVADVMDGLDSADGKADLVCTNLFFHHFETDVLRTMLTKLATRTRFVAACEPRRSALALAGSRMVFAIGCNDVTRHDAVASVEAGFSGRELAALWPDAASDNWAIHEGAAGLFTHTFTAKRISGHFE